MGDDWKWKRESEPGRLEAGQNIRPSKETPACTKWDGALPDSTGRAHTCPWWHFWRDNSLPTAEVCVRGCNYCRCKHGARVLALVFQFWQQRETERSLLTSLSYLFPFLCSLLINSFFSSNSCKLLSVWDVFHAMATCLISRLTCTLLKYKINWE